MLTSLTPTHPKGPKSIPDQLDFATGLQGAARMPLKAHKPHTSGAAGCKVAMPCSQKLQATTDSKLAAPPATAKTLPEPGQGESSRLLLGFIFHLAHADLRNRLWNLIPTNSYQRAAQQRGTQPRAEPKVRSCSSVRASAFR